MTGLPRGTLPVSTAIFLIAIHAHCVVACRQRIDAVQVVALHPILQLAGLVASVGAHFKHGDHHDFDLNGARLGGSGGGHPNNEADRKKKSCVSQH